MTSASPASCSSAPECDRAAGQLPGALATGQGNPGAGRVRISLVPRWPSASRPPSASGTSSTALRPMTDIHKLPGAHRRCVRAPGRAHAQEPARASSSMRHRCQHRAAGPRQGARRRAQGRRRMGRQRVAEEGGAAVFPLARQCGHGCGLHAFLRQGAAQVRAGDGGRVARRAARAWCRTRWCARAPTSRRTWC